MKVGDLVRFVGFARYYEGAVGVITELYSTHDGKGWVGQHEPNTAVVYMPDRPEGRSLRKYNKPCFHPLDLNELELMT